MLAFNMQGLTQVEEMLISAVLPIMTLYRLPQGQYGYSGHVVNLPQDIGSFATSLPWHPHQLDVIIVRKEGSNQTHRDLRVRRSVVLKALQWLVANNIYYHNIRIDPAVVAQLPHDDDLSSLCTVTFGYTCDEEEDTVALEVAYRSSSLASRSSSGRVTFQYRLRHVPVRSRHVPVQIARALSSMRDRKIRPW